MPFWGSWVAEEELEEEGDESAMLRRVRVIELVWLLKR